MSLHHLLFISLVLCQANTLMESMYVTSVVRIEFEINKETLKSDIATKKMLKVLHRLIVFSPNFRLVRCSEGSMTWAVEL